MWRLAPALEASGVGALRREDGQLAWRPPPLFIAVRPPPPRLDRMPRDVFGAGGAVEDDAVQLLQTIGEVERLSVGEPDVKGVLVARLELFELLGG